VPINVFVADDSESIRNAIRLVVKSQAEIRIIGEATNFVETIEKVNQLRPDVIVLDLSMPFRYDQPTGFKEYLCGAKVLAITFGKDEVAEALAEHIGADKLIDKSELTAELIPMILQLAQLGASC